MQKDKTMIPDENNVYLEYLEEKRQSRTRMKVFLKSQQIGSNKNITSKMLSGFIHSFDDYCIRLEEEECIIFINEVVSMKPDDGRDRRDR